MRLPPEIVLSSAMIAVVTIAYVTVAAEGPPRASGLVGHGLGVAGFLAMIIGTLGYTWRKRRTGPGPMHRWLQAHVLSGLVGPYLVLLHTSFTFRGIAGLAMLVLAVVVASGLIGRFIYTSIPKPPSGYIVSDEAIAAEARAAMRKRRVLSPWWLLHVPVAMALFALAVIHVLAALYYETLPR